MQAEGCQFLRPSPHRYYTGLTADIASRPAAHNAGLSKHTATGRPWCLTVSISFADEAQAESFDRYLKSGCRTSTQCDTVSYHG
jgi:putative endonuclease